MSLKDKLMDDLKSAMKDKDTIRKNAVQMVRASVLQVEKDNKITLDDEGVIEVVAKEVKKRKDVLPEYEKSGRQDLIDDLSREIEVLMAYLPQQMSEEEIEAVAYGSHVRPARVFHLNGQTLIDALYAGADPSQMLDFTRPELRRDLVGELPEHLWGLREDAQISLLSHLARYKVFALPGAQGCGVFFMLYEDASPVMVTWEAYNDCMNTAAFFMPDEGLAAVTNAEELSAWFAGKGMPEVRFEEVPLT